MTKRACVFCEQPGRITREHAIPVWVSDALGVVRVDPMTRGAGTVARPMNGLDILVNDVCSSCNGGWMSELEAAFKTSVPGILIGDGMPITIQPAEQGVLALWAAKTAYMITAGTAFATAGADVPTAHLTALYRTGRPPANTTVHLGAVDAQGTLISWTKPTTFSRDGDWVGYDIPFSIGHTLFIVHHWSSPLSYRLTPDVEARLLPIWPPTGAPATWPPLPPFTEADLMSIWGTRSRPAESGRSGATPNVVGP